MTTIKPFRALRLVPEHAEAVASPPYDVVGTDEAHSMARANPSSFMRVIRPEADFEADVDPASPDVYSRGRENLDRLVSTGVLRRDAAEGVYLYRQEVGGHEQTGLVACLPVDAYLSGSIRKHEHTRPGKVEDRSRHMEALDAQPGPVFTVYRALPAVDALISEATAGEPEFRFTSDDGVAHTVWSVNGSERAGALVEAFGGVGPVYIADGHHRAEAASRVAEARRRTEGEGGGKGPWDCFLAVLFPHDQVRILPYNRVVRDLGSLTGQEVLSRAAAAFEVIQGDRDATEQRPGSIRLYLDGRWHELTPRPGTVDPADPVGRLDAAVLQSNLLAPVLGIEDQRRDERLQFVGGDRGEAGLVDLVESGRFRCAFSLRAVRVEEVMSVADAGATMPPKSTWFDPKLRSGLFVHCLST